MAAKSELAPKSMKNLGMEVVVTQKLYCGISIKMAQFQGLDVVHPVIFFRRFSGSSPLTFLGHLCANSPTPKSVSVKCVWLPQYIRFMQFLRTMRFFMHYLVLLNLEVLSFFENLVHYRLLCFNKVLEPCAAAQGWFVKLLGTVYAQMTLLNQFDVFFRNVNSWNASSDGIVKISAALSVASDHRL